MSEYSYLRGIDTEFHGYTPNDNTLRNLVGSSDISANIIRIVIADAQVDFVFDASLNLTEQTTLTTICNDYPIRWEFYSTYNSKIIRNYNDLTDPSNIILLEDHKQTKTIIRNDYTDGSVNIISRGMWVADGSAQVSFFNSPEPLPNQVLKISNNTSQANWANLNLKNTITVSESGGDFTTIYDAIASITDASADNTYGILVGPGVYVEQQLNVPSYVSVVGSSINSTIVEPSGLTHHVFSLSKMTELSFMTIRNCGNGYACVYAENIGNFAQLHKISIYYSDNGIIMDTTSIDSTLYIEYVDINTYTTNAVKATASGSFTGFINMENFYVFSQIGFDGDSIFYDGNMMSSDMSSCGLNGGDASDNMIRLINGVTLKMKSITITDCYTGIFLDSSGSGGSTTYASGVLFNNCGLYNINIEDPSAIGYFTGYTEYDKKYINESNSFFITNKDQHIITVAEKGGDFASIYSALNAITDASETHQYVVSIGPGLFIEPLLIIPAFVSVTGSTINATIVEPDTSGHHVFQMGNITELSFLTIRNAGSGYAGIYVEDVGDFAQMHKISIYSCDIGIWMEGISELSQLYVEYTDIDDYTTCAVKAHTSTGIDTFINMENFYTYSPIGFNGDTLIFDGSGVKSDMSSSRLEGSDGSENLIHLINGSSLKIKSVSLLNGTNGICVDGSGENCSLIASSLTFDNCSGFNICVKDSTATGYLTGYIPYEKQMINPISPFFITGKDFRNIIVAKKGGDFTSVKTAVESITNASPDNYFLVSIDPGDYIEGPITIPPYVYIKGSTVSSVNIEASGTHNIFTCSNDTGLSFLTVSGAQSGYSGILCRDISQNCTLFRIAIENCATGVHIDSSNSYCHIDINNLTIDGFSTNAMKVTSNGINRCETDINNLEIDSSVGFAGDVVLIDGSGTTFDIIGASIAGDVAGNIVRITNGGTLNIKSSTLIGCTNGIYLDPSGSNPTLIANSVTFANCSQYDLYVANSTATGYYSGYVEYPKQNINYSSGFFITNKDAQIITVSKKGGDFTSINSAITSITDASSTKPYTIFIGPGTFIESTITMKQFVSLKGSGDQITTIQTDSSNNTIIVGKPNCAIEDLQITGAFGDNGIGISGTNFGNTNPLSVTKCVFGTNTKQLYMLANANAMTFVNVRSCRLGAGNCTTGFHVSGTSPFFPAILTFSDSYFLDVITPYPVTLFNCQGLGTQVIIISAIIRSLGTTGTAIEISDGARLRMLATSIVGFNRGIYVKNSGSPAVIKVSSVTIEDTSSNDIYIESPTSTGAINGQFSRNKIYQDSASPITISYNDNTFGGFNIVGDLNQGTRHDRLLNISTLLRGEATVGLVSGGNLTQNGQFTLDVSGGTGFLVNPTSGDNYVKQVTWDASQLTISSNVDNYIYIDTNSTINANASPLTLEYMVLLGRVATDTSGIIAIERSKLSSNQYGNQVEDALIDTLGAIYKSGSTTTESSTARRLNVTAGKYYFGTNLFESVDGSDITWDAFYVDASNSWVREQGQNTLSNTQYNLYDTSGGGLVSLTASYYTKHNLYMLGYGTTQKYYLLYGQDQAIDASGAQNLPVNIKPLWMTRAIVPIADIVVRQGTTNIIGIIDTRPRLGFSASSSSSSSSNDHGSLSGLSNDDHPQYLLTNGGRTMTGPLNMGGNLISNVNTVNGVTVQTHASRHQFGSVGQDAFLSDVPVTIADSTTANADGKSGIYFARSDHQHAHGALTGGGLHAVVDSSKNGFMSSTDKIKVDSLTVASGGGIVGFQEVKSLSSNIFSTSTVLTTEPLLGGFALTAGRRYIIKGVLMISATTSSNQGIKIAMDTNVTSSVYKLTAILMDTGTRSQNSDPSGNTWTLEGTSGTFKSTAVCTKTLASPLVFPTLSGAPSYGILSIMFVEGFIFPTTSGTLNFQWGINAASANPSIIHSGSDMYLMQV
jgi:pectin methylesterase-like acyl-CoA thioesterase